MSELGNVTSAGFDEGLLGERHHEIVKVVFGSSAVFCCCCSSDKVLGS
jgi:hypothetical protein